MTACDRCVYQHYVNREKTICIHKKAQLALAKKGIKDLNRDTKLQVCPHRSSHVDYDKIGSKESHGENRFNARSSKTEKPDQRTLF